MDAKFTAKILMVSVLTFSSSSGAISMSDCRKSTCQVSALMLWDKFKIAFAVDTYWLVRPIISILLSHLQAFFNERAEIFGTTCNIFTESRSKRTNNSELICLNITLSLVRIKYSRVQDRRKHVN